MRFHFLLIVVLQTTALTVSAQYFQYSQSNFSQQRINPAMVASSNYASIGLLYRNQSAGGDTNLKSSLVSGAYPVLNGKTGRRWSGVGFSVMDDRAGGIFTTQEVSVSYAVNIFLDRFQTLSLGFKGLYQQRSVNLEGLYTGSQYIPDRGFDLSAFNGENIELLRSDFMTFSTGLYWQRVDREGTRLAYWGLSLFDFNKPEDSFSGVETHLNSTLIFNGGVRIYEHKQLAIMPEVLFTRSAGNNVFNIGAVTSYYVRRLPNQVAPRIDFLTKYVVGRSGIIGFQLHKENFSIGFNYDFPVVKVNVANTGAFELGIELRKLVVPKLKRKTFAKKKPGAGAKQAALKTVEKKPVTAKNNGRQTLPPNQSDSIRLMKPGALKTTLQQKQDSALASAEVGNIKHEPLLLEKILLHFNFEFNSVELDEASTKYLDDLVEALKENAHLKIRLTGHTDNVGSARFNQRLSLYRADAIKSYLTEKGIEESRVQTEGRGLAEPLNENKTEEERARNRRVELLILYED